MKLEAMWRQGFRTDLTSSQLGTKLLLKKGGTGTAADIIFSDGKYGKDIVVERMKNLFAVLKNELKNKCFYLDQGRFWMTFFYLLGRIYAYGKDSYTPENRGSARLSGRQGHEGSFYFPAYKQGTEKKVLSPHL